MSTSKIASLPKNEPKISKKNQKNLKNLRKFSKSYNTKASRATQAESNSDAAVAADFVGTPPEHASALRGWIFCVSVCDVSVCNYVCVSTCVRLW
jgi:hypothetical protein